jgi:glycogenin glucosyltransferase
MGGFAWVTLATNDSYSLGALVLAHSLKQVGTNHQLVVLVTPGVTNAMKEKLSSVFNLVQEVNILDSKDEANLRLLKRPELGVTFTKLHCWRLTQFDKCVFLDADTLVLKNCDELFDREGLSAAPDVGWPDCFNSGVFVYSPSNATYENLVQLALDKGSFDGGDQGLLNLYFSDWATKDISKHLPFIYNLCSTACYSYLPAFKQFGGDAKIIHFIGTSKPWLQYFNTETRKVQPTPDLKHLEAILQHWWNIFCSLIHPRLSPEMARSSSDVTHTSISSRTSRDHDKPQPDSIKNVIWDPWEEYDQKHSSFVPQTESLPPSNPGQNFPPTNQTHSNFVDAHQTRTLYTHQTHPTPYPHQVNEPSQIKPIESHNTNACYNASQEHNPPSVPEQPERSQPFSFRENSQHKNFSDDDRPHPSPPPPPPPLSFDDRPKYVAPPPVSNTFHVPQASPGPFHSSQDSPVQSELVTPKPAEQTFPVPPNECEAAATVCKETTLHTPSCEDSTASGLAGAFAQLTLGAPRTAEQSALDDHLRRQGWEVGNIDYMGRDSFDNIWSKICETLSAGLPAEASKTTASVKLPEQEVPPPVPAPQDTATDTSVAPSETPKTVSEVSQSISLEQPALVSPPQQETIRTEPSPAPPTSDAPPKSQQEASPAAEPLQCPIPTKPKEPTAAEPQVPVPPTPKEEAPAEGPQCPVPPKPKEPALLECSLPPKTQDASVKAVSDAPVTPDSAQVPSEAAKPAVATEQASQAAPAPQEVAPPAAQETVAPTAPPETVVPSQTPPAPAQEVPKATTPAEVTPPPQAAAPTEVAALPQPVAPAEAPASPQAATPAEVAAPPQAATPAEVAAPPEATKPAEIAAPPQAATPAEAPAPPEAVKLSEVAAPPQASTPAEAAAPPQKATPAEIAAPPQAITPAEAPAPQATTPAVAPAPQATTPAEAPGPKATAPPETTKSAESAPTQTPPAEAAAPPKDAASTPAQEAQPAPQEKGAVSASAVPPTETAQPTSPVSSTPQPESTQVPPATTQASATPKAETTPSTPTSEGPKTKSEQSKQAKQEAAQSATSATSPTPPPRKGTGPGKKSKAKK